jgi:hypothetical protein
LPFPLPFGLVVCTCCVSRAAAGLVVGCSAALVGAAVVDASSRVPTCAPGVGPGLGWGAGFGVGAGLPPPGRGRDLERCCSERGRLDRCAAAREVPADRSGVPRWDGAANAGTRIVR